MSAGLGDATLFDCGMCNGTGRIVNAWIAMHEEDYVDEPCRQCGGEGERPDRLTSSAVLSPDGLYRYLLTRTWGKGPIATFLMCNASKADAELNDPTVIRCIGFAKSWGCGGLRVGNAYGLRSTDPKGLWLVPDPVGPKNDAYLSDLASIAWSRGWPLVAAWGANVKPDRVAQVLALPGMGSLQALGVTKSGAPRHPLYLRSDAVLRPWPVQP